MPSVEDYLRQRFVGAAEFAASCGISEDHLDALIEQGLVPAPAYTVSAAGMQSHVFGLREAPGAPPGRWFNPGGAAWVARAQQALAECRDAPLAAVAWLRDRFADGYRHAFQQAHQEAPIPGMTTTDGSFDGARFDEQFASVWEHFQQGTYGLCVALPHNEAAIANKEVAQVRLTALTENGTRTSYTPEDATAARALIARYVEYSMPFSPVEYPISSRKRLVDDVLPRIAVH